MPSKKKKYNARFPAGRIKKIMQTDEEVGKVAQAVPVIISRTLELFVESLLRTAMQITSAKNAKTLTPTHMKQCIQSESRFDFLRDLVQNVPDVSSTEDEPGTPSSPAVSCASRAHTSYSGFQFGKPERKVHKSHGSTSQAQTGLGVETSPAPSLVQPRFYNEIPIGSDEENQRSPAVPARAPVIQHTADCDSINNIPPTHHKTSYASSSSEEEDDETPPQAPPPGAVSQNGFHPPPAPPPYRPKTVDIDEDYDT